MPASFTVDGARAYSGEIDRYEAPEIEETPHMIHWEAWLDTRDDDGIVVGAVGRTPEAAEGALRAKLLALRATIDDAMGQLP